MLRTILASSIAAVLSTSVVLAETDYPPAPETKPQEGVPKGEVLKFTFDQSKIFPGTTRDYSVYVPKQYDPSKPACVWVNQDGIQNSAPVVFDNMIAKGEIPVIIGVFIGHGRVKAPRADALDRFNRSYEYDGLGDSYVRFLLEELLPDVETKKTSDGREIRLSKNGNDRAIGGSSSGAIAAFTAAWERPDAFSRVFSTIGTYVGLRGGNVYPTLVRKYEPKPIRVFQQDGSNDNNIYGGDWWMANQELERAFTFAGYEHEHVWGDGGHNGKQAAAVFPDGLRFLWKGWPEPVKAGLGSKQLQEILIPGEGWQLVADGFKFTEGPTPNAKGELFFSDIPNSRIHKVGIDGKVTVFAENTDRANGLAFAPDGRLLACADGGKKIVAYDAAGKVSTVADGFNSNDIAMLADGSFYVTEPPTKQVWFVNAKGEKRVVDTGLNFPNGVCTSPDQTLLNVADMKSHWVYSYQIQADGSLAHKQRYYHLHVPDSADDAGADGMRADADGRLYVATRMGVQVCDQAGRVNCIIPTPEKRPSNVAFGGEKFDTLFATCGDKVFKRKVKPHGVQGFAAPVKPAPPRL